VYGRLPVAHGRSAEHIGQRVGISAYAEIEYPHDRQRRSVCRRNGGSVDVSVFMAEGSAAATREASATKPILCG
jgi:hypothetical protein